MGSIPIHLIEQQISGHYDISHGRVMTILIPAYLDHFADARVNLKNMAAWSPAMARKALSPILEKVDILIFSLNDAATVFDYKSTDAEEVVKGLQHQFRNQTVVLTLADRGALAYDGRNSWYQDAYQSSNVDRIGRGDSFSAGFLYGYLTGNVCAGLQYGNAMAALNQTLKGDFFWGEKEDVDRLIAGRSKKLDR
jgi:2-dehydro-3-deoxygluconokinase